MKKKLLVLGAVLILIVSLTGCLGQSGGNSQGNEQPSTGNESPKEKSPDTETVDFTVYFSDEDAMYLKGETRTVAKNGKYVAELMLAELLKGPESEELSPTIPEGTKLLSLEVADKIATVNFSREIQTNHPGGSAGETMTVYSIVNTLTQLEDIDAVQFLVEGEKEEAIWGHLYTLEPIEPNQELIQN